ncbi:MAG: hypothetical protein ABFR62_12650 [Bacteroidota bacterium]
MCSEQLKAYEGLNENISESSIHRDIEVMRGDSLGFNAPVIGNKDMYRYSDKNYSIVNSSIYDMALLKRVMYLLLEEKDNKAYLKLQKVLSDISDITGIEFIAAEYDHTDQEDSDIDIGAKESCYIENFAPSSSFTDFHEAPEEKEEEGLYSWKKILDAITFG